MSSKRGRPAGHLSEDQVREFLASKPGWAVLTSIGRDGYPHSVPLGYFMADDDVVLGTLAGTQKLKNIERNPRVTVLLDRTEGSVLTGVMIQGDAELVTEDKARLALQRVAARARGVAEADLPTQVRPGGAYVRVHPHKIITWHFE